MTEKEWLAEGRHPQAMVNALCRMPKVSRTKAGKRKLRLFACGSCRVIWPLLAKRKLRQAVEVAERFAEGEGEKSDLEESYDSIGELTAGEYLPEAPGVRARTAASMAQSATLWRATSAAYGITTFPLPLAGHSVGKLDGDAVLCNLLRCVFGNPFDPAKIDRSSVRRKNSTVSHLAQVIYDKRRFQDLPILGDALEEAGCTDETILSHCRGPGPHVRGCWVVDLLLGKE